MLAVSLGDCELGNSGSEFQVSQRCWVNWTRHEALSEMRDCCIWLARSRRWPWRWQRTLSETLHRRRGGGAWKDTPQSMPSVCPHRELRFLAHRWAHTASLLISKVNFFISASEMGKTGIGLESEYGVFVGFGVVESESFFCRAF